MRHPTKILVCWGIMACASGAGADETGVDPTDTSEDTGGEDTAEESDTGTADTGAGGSGCSASLRATLQEVAAWPIRGTCSNAALYFGTADQTERLAFAWRVPERELSVGERFVLIYDGDDPDAVTGEAELQVGQHLLAWDCNDAVLEEPVIEVDLMPTGGEASLVVTSWTDSETWSGTVVLSNLEFSDGEEVCRVPDLTLSGLSFGWLPG